MLSILIPIYNTDCRALVQVLHTQGQLLDTPFEIRCYDDGSSEDFKRKNRDLQLLSQVVYVELPENLGRAGIRNRLGLDAQGEYLIFMDGDAKVVRHDFLQKYWVNRFNAAVLCGGTAYVNIPPCLKYRLHWTCGKQREVPSLSFKTFNFFIKKNFFTSILFDDTLRKYGHEDTLFGLSLRRRSINVTYIDNPLEHDGLEPINVFLNKQEQALSNLAQIAPRYPDLAQEVKAWRVYQILKRWRVAFLIGIIWSVAGRLIMKNLHSTKPNLVYFDIWKLETLRHLS